MFHLELSPVEEKEKEEKKESVEKPKPVSVVPKVATLEPLHLPAGLGVVRRASRSMKPVHKSASASALTLLIPPSDEYSPQPITSPGGSSTSSRDGSPSREFSPILGGLKPPIYIKKGPRGYGFTLRAIRVYYGESDYYTLHHLVVVSIR